MFSTLDDFLRLWQLESTRTARLMECLTDESLPRLIASGHRSLGDLAWHIVVSHRSILDKTGLTFEAATKDLPTPRNAAEICAKYVASAAGVGRAIETQWTNATLRIADDVYGVKWFRSQTLLALVSHEIHHRGQMTVLMRQAGLSLPATYGPSKDTQ